MSSVSPFFTICMPVYKSEPYISGAIDDLIGQTFKDFECIVIDDCSPDSASRVARGRVGQDGRFKFMKNKKNLGVSATRNKGLEKAKGEYILFLDSDDRYSTSLLQRVYDQIKLAENDGIQVDVVTWEFGSLGNEDQKIKQLEGWRENEIRHNPKPGGVYVPSEVASRLFQVNINSVWVKAFRVEYLSQEKIVFTESMKFGEDALFSHTAVCLASAAIAVPGDDILYYYRRDQPNSAMHMIDMSNQMKDQLEVISALKSNLEDRKIYDIYASSFERWVSDGVGAVLNRITNRYIENRNHLDAQIFEILNSRSWRITKFLRKNTEL